MRRFIAFTCLSALSLLAACAPQGYYDAQGNYVPYSYNDARPVPGGGDYPYDPPPSYYTYDRAGYYDYYGAYYPMDAGLNIPARMYPPRGMCRVWFPERVAADQPRVESCRGIQERVPPGAYVIYGG